MDRRRNGELTMIYVNMNTQSRHGTPIRSGRSAHPEVSERSAYRMSPWTMTDDSTAVRTVHAPHAMRGAACDGVGDELMTDTGTGCPGPRAGELESWRAGELESWRAGEP